MSWVHIWPHMGRTLREPDNPVNPGKLIDSGEVVSSPNPVSLIHSVIPLYGQQIAGNTVGISSLTGHTFGGNESSLGWFVQ